MLRTENIKLARALTMPLYRWLNAHVKPTEEVWDYESAFICWKFWPITVSWSADSQGVSVCVYTTPDVFFAVYHPHDKVGIVTLGPSPIY